MELYPLQWKILNHWTTREVPRSSLLKHLTICCFSKSTSTTSLWWKDWQNTKELELKEPLTPCLRRWNIALSISIFHNLVTYLSSRIQKKFLSRSFIKLSQCPRVNQPCCRIRYYKVGPVYQSIHLLPASWTCFYSKLKSISFHRDNSKVPIVCIIRFQNHLQLYLASPERTRVIFSRDMYWQYALAWNDIWAHQSLCIFPWIFPLHHENSGEILRGILSLINKHMPCKLPV